MSLTLQVSTHTKTDFEFKMKKRLNSEDIVYLKFNPQSPEDMSETGLYNIKEEPVSSHQNVYRWGQLTNQGHSGAQDYNTEEHILTVTRLYCHIQLKVLKHEDNKHMLQTRGFISSLVTELAKHKTWHPKQATSCHRQCFSCCTLDSHYFVGGVEQSVLSTIFEHIRQWTYYCIRHQ